MAIRGVQKSKVAEHGDRTYWDVAGLWRDAERVTWLAGLQRYQRIHPTADVCCAAPRPRRTRVGGDYNAMQTHITLVFRGVIKISNVAYLDNPANFDLKFKSGILSPESSLNPKLRRILNIINLNNEHNIRCTTHTNNIRIFMLSGGGDPNHVYMTLRILQHGFEDMHVGRFLSQLLLTVSHSTYN